MARKTRIVTRIAFKSLCDLTEEEHKQCLRLNKKDRGNMFHIAKAWKSKYANRIKVALAKQGPLVLGWAAPDYSDWHEETSINVYVKCKYRRRGIATKLIERFLREYPDTNFSFYRNMRSNVKNPMNLPDFDDLVESLP